MNIFLKEIGQNSNLIIIDNKKRRDNLINWLQEQLLIMEEKHLIFQENQKESQMKKEKKFN